MPDKAPNTETRFLSSLHRHLLVGCLLCLVLVGGAGGWAAKEEISGAVIAPGVVVVESKAKRVQHQEGGTVKEILVRDGQLVQGGEIVARLDDTVIKANLAMIRSELDELMVKQARLLAERDEHSNLHFSEDLVRRGREDPVLRSHLHDQVALRQARRATLEGQKAQLQEQINQLKGRIRGLIVQRTAKSESVRLINERIAALTPLLPEGLVMATELTVLRRDRAELVGERGDLIAQVAQVHETISERRIHILQLEEEFRSEVLETLHNVRARIAQLQEERVAALDTLQRIDIRASRTGYVHQLNIHTIGGVIGAGETLMMIVPQEDVLIVEAQVNPTDVDQVQPGQEAIIRLPAFHQRVTPELTATVTTLAADLTHDEYTGSSYYLARLGIGETELRKLGDKQLVPGMPIETFIQTGDRTVLSYLIKPLTDHLAHAFKE